MSRLVKIIGKLNSRELDRRGLNKLFRMAMKTRACAQAPYSKFLVGAAVESVNGNIYIGCNVERCSYTEGTHAEQNAIDTMIANEGSVKIGRLVLVGAPSGVDLPTKEHDTVHSPESTELCGCNSQLVWPCGHCRQIIWENCLDDGFVGIYTLSKSGDVFMLSIQDLYPDPFGPENVGINYGIKGEKNG